MHPVHSLLAAALTTAATAVGVAAVPGPAAAPAAPAAAAASELIRDGGFEATSAEGDSPGWAEQDDATGTPLCTADCGGVGPRSGGWWAWFGGTPQANTSSLTQTVTLPAGGAALTFWLRLDPPPTINEASLTVAVDGTVLTTFADDVTETAWTQRAVDLARFADGAAHTLTFAYANPREASGAPGFNVDDVSIVSTPPGTTTTTPPAASAPDTAITQAPRTKLTTKKKKAEVSFSFTSPTAGATFQCSLDGGASTACAPGVTWKVKAGKHTFAVRAVAAGLSDPTPATASFKVRVKKHHRVR